MLTQNIIGITQLNKIPNWFSTITCICNDFSKKVYLSFSFPDVQCESYKLTLSSTAPAIDGVNVTFIGDVTINGHVPHFTDKLDWVRSNHSYMLLFGK